MTTLHLTENEATALWAALDRYTDGEGMKPEDEDADTLAAILSRLA